MIERNPAKVVAMVEQLVRRVVRRGPQNTVHSLEEVAHALDLSTRSLQRHLAKQGTSFSEIIARVRRQYALELLVQDTLNISEIAHAVGYSDPSNFCRAFHKWTGQSPYRCRSKMLEQALPDGSNG